MKELEIDLSLSNKELYEGCRIRELQNGTMRLHLVTPLEEAVKVVQGNLKQSLSRTVILEKLEEITLSGGPPREISMAVAVIAANYATKVFSRNKSGRKTQIK